jgi:hypothetical protein
MILRSHEKNKNLETKAFDSNFLLINIDGIITLLEH